jgi:hypothetical protein
MAGEEMGRIRPCARRNYASGDMRLKHAAETLRGMLLPVQLFWQELSEQIVVERLELSHVGLGVSLRV